MPNYEEMYITDITEELKALQSKMEEMCINNEDKINNKNLLHEKKYF